MKAIAQKRISDFFNKKPKKDAKKMKHFIFKVTNETKDNEESICLNDPKESYKNVKKTCKATKKRERNKGDYGSTVQLVIYRFCMKWLSKRSYERSYVKEFHGNCSIRKARKNFFVQDIGNS